ncbi:MAG: DUF1223 domain-containing protein [Candidatus Acidiferrales bacterium]
MASIICARALVRADFAQVPSATSAVKRPVLVELFTSEGCSSCPPADALLSKLGSQQPVAGAETIILEEHVDYWDDQGWRDPFASTAATERQKEYAFHLGGESYTPEMIVDGRAAFVGSDGGEARKEIEAATGAPKAEVHLEWANSPGAAAGASFVLHIRVGRLPATADGAKPEVFLAITEDHLHSSVLRGENTGRALDHDGVVRQLTRVGVATVRNDSAYDGQSPLKLNANWKRENLRAVVFVQDPKTRRVFAAAAIPF